MVVQDSTRKAMEAGCQQVRVVLDIELPADTLKEIIKKFIEMGELSAEDEFPNFYEIESDSSAVNVVHRTMFGGEGARDALVLEIDDDMIYAYVPEPKEFVYNLLYIYMERGFRSFRLWAYM
jgi:hypothetical protein